MLAAWLNRIRTGPDPRQARHFNLETLRWIWTRRAYTPYHLLRYFRYGWFRFTHPHVVTTGIVFLGRRVSITSRPGYGTVVLGAFTHIGNDCRISAHEGTITVGERTVLGSSVTITSYLSLRIGSRCMIADGTYLTDFDHTTTETTIPIKDQGLTKTPVTIGDDCWLGVRATVLRGSTVGNGCVLAAHTVARGYYPPLSVVAGVPGVVVKRRGAATPKADTMPGAAEPRTSAVVFDPTDLRDHLAVNRIPVQPQGGIE